MKQTFQSFIKLTSFEFDRVFKFLVTLMGITVISNLIGFIWIPLKYRNGANQAMVEENLTTQQILEHFGQFTFDTVTNSFWILGPIALGIIGFGFYSFFIWYREWFGKNTFAYRLLMLPVSRMQVFFSKLAIIFVGIFSLVAIQLIVLYIGYHIGSAIIPNEFMASTSFLSMLSSQITFYYVLPIQASNFFVNIGVGIAMLLVLFTIILIERCYSIKGIVMGIAYGVTSLFIAILPFAIGDIFNNYYILYDSEMVILVSLMLIIISAVSITLSRYLINNKITV